MALSSLSILQIAIVAALFLAGLTATSASRISAGMARRPQFGFRIGLSHVDSGKNLTRMEIVRRSFRRDLNRLHHLSRAEPASKVAHGSEFQARVSAGNGDYEMNVSVGTPPVLFTAIMDTGSDLIWTQCMPCFKCGNQTLPRFDPKRSSSVSNVSCTSNLCKALPTHNCSNGCDYMYSYGDSSSTEGYLAADTFTFGDGSVHHKASIPNVAFGCGVYNQGTGLDTGRGVMGIGWGPLSLVTQLGITKFSYCLAPFDGIKTGNLLVGSKADPNRTADDPHKTTRLIKNPSNPTFYYVPLEGISVGLTRLLIPRSTFEIAKDGSGGVIVDSGTSVTMISEDAYDMVREAFIQQINLPVADGSSSSTTDTTGSDSDSAAAGLDLCFELGGKKAKEVAVPKLTFHFTGMDLVLPPENYIIPDPARKTVCLAMAPSGVLSIFGNIQQQNLLVVHDLEKETLSFVPARCDRV